MYLFAISIELALIFIFEEGWQLGGAVNIAGLTCLGKAGAIVTVINAVRLGGVIYVTIILVRGMSISGLLEKLETARSLKELLR